MLCLEFRQIPSSLEFEVSELSSDVNKYGLQRYFSALPCYPVVENVVKCPGEHKFIVKFRTQSGNCLYTLLQMFYVFLDVKGVMNMNIKEFPPIRRGLLPRICRVLPKSLKAFAGQEDSFFLGTSVVCSSVNKKRTTAVNKPATFPLPQPQIQPELMNFMLRTEQPSIIKNERKVGWKWDDANGQSELFPPRENRALELAFMTKEKIHVLPLYGEDVSVDFTAMTMQNPQTKVKKKISRRQFDLPGNLRAVSRL